MKRYLVILPIIVFLASCDSMIRYIDIAPIDEPARLAVSAVIDTDSGTFRLTFADARKLDSEWHSADEVIVRPGSIRLYEDEQLIFSKDSEGDGFHISQGDQNSGYSFVQKGLNFKAGSSYRLEIEIDGYPTTTATAVMPQAPILGGISIDNKNKVKKNNVLPIGAIGGDGWSGYFDYFSPLTVGLTDNSPERDYYLFRQEDITVFVNSAEYGNRVWRENIPIGTDNMLLVQDNPDYESESGLFSAEGVDAYIFPSRMLISDLTFANATVDLKLLSSAQVENPNPKPCGETNVNVNIYLTVSHVSKFCYDHYRSMVLQYGGVGFFTEPVTIVGNVENGYGAFIAFNTTRIRLGGYDTCEGVMAGE